MPNQKSQNRGKPLTSKKQPLSRQETADYIIGVLTNILSDAYETLSSYSCADFTADKATIKRRVIAEGPVFATEILPNLAKGLFLYLESGEASYPQFKLVRGQNYPIFLKGMFKRAFGSLCDVEKAGYVKYIYQVSVAFKKLKGPFDENRLKKQWDDFVKVDEELSNLAYENSDETKQILELARYYMRNFIKNIDVDTSPGFIPRPGPGATNTPLAKCERYEAHTFYKSHNEVLPYKEWFYPRLWTNVVKLRQYLDRLETIRVEPSARFLFVPKVAGKARGICIEENESQFLQQAVANGLRYAVATSDLSPYINFTDQTVNAGLALASSVTKANATIDMSEASDRIWRALVSYLFQDNERLHSVLLALSTRLIEPPRESRSRTKVRLNKFAPMGSGLCFPIMSLVHYCLVKAIMRRNAKEHRDDDVLYVYGDDIIIPSNHAQSVFDLLPKFGMKLNVTKSFHRSPFRESCGVHAFAGVDITPVYFRNVPKRGHADALASCVATEELLFDRGLGRTAMYLRNEINVAYRKLGYVSKKSSVIGYRRSQYFLFTWLDQLKASCKKTKWSSDLQCWLYRVQVFVKDTVQTTILDPSSAYLRWLCQKTDDSEHVLDITKDDLKVAWRWVIESSLCGSESA